MNLVLQAGKDLVGRFPEAKWSYLFTAIQHEYQVAGLKGLSVKIAEEMYNGLIFPRADELTIYFLSKLDKMKIKSFISNTKRKTSTRVIQQFFGISQGSLIEWK